MNNGKIGFAALQNEIKNQLSKYIIIGGIKNGNSCKSTEEDKRSRA